MNPSELETLSRNVGPEAAMMIFGLRQLEAALMSAAAPKKEVEPFYSVLQSAEDERRKELNKSNEQTT